MHQGCRQNGRRGIAADRLQHDARIGQANLFGLLARQKPEIRVCQNRRFAEHFAGQAVQRLLVQAFGPQQ